MLFYVPGFLFPIRWILKTKDNFGKYCKTLFISYEEEHAIIFDLPLFFKQFLAPGGLNAECVQISVVGLQLALRPPRPKKLKML